MKVQINWLICNWNSQNSGLFGKLKLMETGLACDNTANQGILCFICQCEQPPWFTGSNVNDTRIPSTSP